MLALDPQKRTTDLQRFLQHSFVADVDWDAVLNMKIKPSFIPPKDHLNCDPTFELEEMIIEAKPLHKKKKRLAKQGSKAREVDEEVQSRLLNLSEEFVVYNRDNANKVKDVVVQESNGHAEDEDAVEDVKTMQETNHDRKDQAEVTGPT
ncbi:putative serine/threonine-protein kinase 32B isoform X2 [Apostichopus japonicus]|uniref:Putative serine/threonine-protein kinase 32B isoform X2 n=1 Tax=Stichopus japonicus TaxID=307972 RepID=A0A2G8JDD6_STIJA|nr:putative serine/threonine-protein kinase 32B isoform X2 [Apostichopus japonicus]